jgi:glycosyltransferase involved in cell wall biosynthesis
MINENILICGVVKNASKYLEKSIKLCIKTGELFKNCKIIIYENNSTDNTKNILQEHIDNPNFKIIMEDIPNEDIKKHSKVWAYTQITGSDHPCRMEQIANARNKVVSECKKTE